jgi:hypothetical protein
MADETGFTDARARVATALVAIGFGDPLPCIDCWAERDDVTLFGAWGPIEQGHAAVTKTFRWVGSRFQRAAGWRRTTGWSASAPTWPIPSALSG